MSWILEQNFEPSKVTGCLIQCPSFHRLNTPISGYLGTLPLTGLDILINTKRIFSSMRLTFQLAIVSPDAGAVERARRVADKVHSETNVVTIIKRRIEANKVRDKDSNNIWYCMYAAVMFNIISKGYAVVDFLLSRPLLPVFHSVPGSQHRTHWWRVRQNLHHCGWHGWYCGWDFSIICFLCTFLKPLRVDMISFTLEVPCVRQRDGWWTKEPTESWRVFRMVFCQERCVLTYSMVLPPLPSPGLCLFISADRVDFGLFFFVSYLSQFYPPPPTGLEKDCWVAINYSRCDWHHPPREKSESLSEAYCGLTRNKQTCRLTLSVQVVPVGEMLAGIIKQIHTEKSISEYITTLTPDFKK